MKTGTIVLSIITFILILSLAMILVYSDDSSIYIEEEPAVIINNSANNLYINSPDFFVPGQPEPIISDPDDPYAHVRFGETRELLLLEVEWHTPGTWLEYVEQQRSWWVEFQEENEWFSQLSERDKRQVIRQQENHYRELENQADRIRRNRFYATTTLNGVPGFNIQISFSRDDEHISEHLSEDGYYIFEIYPFQPHSISYTDENGNWQNRWFDRVSSKRAFDRLLKNEIIPLCDDLLNKGLISSDEYNHHTTFDPLDYYVNMFFDNQE